MTKRKAISKDQKIAALICRLDECRQLLDPALAFWLDCEKSKKMAPLDFQKNIDWDHIIPVYYGGSNHPTNLNPIPKESHKAKTKKDIKVIAKSRRIGAGKMRPVKTIDEAVELIIDTSNEAELLAASLRKKWASRPMPGTKESGIRKRMNGKTERR